MPGSTPTTCSTRTGRRRSSGRAGTSSTAPTFPAGSRWRASCGWKAREWASQPADPAGPPPAATTARTGRAAYGGLDVVTEDGAACEHDQSDHGQPSAHRADFEPSPPAIGHGAGVRPQGAPGEVRHHVDRVQPASRLVGEAEDARLVGDMV